MEEKRKYKKVKKKKTGVFKYEFRYFFIIAVICLALSLGLAFITGRVPLFLDNTIQKQLERLSAEKLREIKKEIVEKAKEGEVEDIIEKYKEQSKKSR